MNENLSYSFHIGNDKNKTTKAKQLAKDKPTNFNNNAIQNGIQLSKVNHHNLRVYENNQELMDNVDMEFLENVDHYYEAYKYFSLTLWLDRKLHPVEMDPESIK